MVRTKAGSVSTKAIGAKALHKVAVTASSSGNAQTRGKRDYSGGNPYHPRETPGWQKPITCFMNRGGESSKDEDGFDASPAEPGPSTSDEASGASRSGKRFRKNSDAADKENSSTSQNANREKLVISDEYENEDILAGIPTMESPKKSSSANADRDSDKVDAVKKNGRKAANNNGNPKKKSKADGVSKDVENDDAIKKKSSDADRKDDSQTEENPREAPVASDDNDSSDSKAQDSRKDDSKMEVDPSEAPLAPDNEDSSDTKDGDSRKEDSADAD